jgi:hypothetical protein
MQFFPLKCFHNFFKGCQKGEVFSLI